MKFILSPDEMRIADNIAINNFKVPGAILMENAARSAAIYISELFEKLNYINPSVTVICGSGNNGGDGFALVRHLIEKCKIEVVWLGKEEKMSPETMMNFAALKKFNVQMTHIEDLGQLKELNLRNRHCLIDSMIGVGGSENIKGLAKEVLKEIQYYEGLKIAIDSPTGLNTESGAASEFCFSADYTITMFAIKNGMVLNQGRKNCGEIFIADLGVPQFIVRNITKNFIIEESDSNEIIPSRSKNSSKFDFGRVILVAGSRSFPGASALAANGAIFSGAGLVQLHSTVIHSHTLPEVISQKLPETEDGTVSIKSKDTLLKASEKANVFGIGSGLSDNKETINLVSQLILGLDPQISIVLDADGLKAIDQDSSLRKNIILTPHLGEFSAMIGVPRAEIEKDTLNIAKHWANKWNCIIVLKSTPVIITDGEYTYININGNPGMATGGSGDVLTGVICGLLAQGVDPISSAALGVFLHAKAGDLYANQYNQETLTASGILEFLRESFPKSV